MNYAKEQYKSVGSRDLLDIVSGDAKLLEPEDRQDGDI